MNKKQFVKNTYIMSIKCTFPSFAREEGSEDQEAVVASVNRLLLRETLTRFPGRPFAGASAVDFLPEDSFCLLWLTEMSTTSPLFAGVFTSLEDGDGDGIRSLVDFLGTCVQHGYISQGYFRQSP